MGIVQTALTKMIGPSVAQLVEPLVERVAALEARPIGALSEADRATLDKSQALVAEFEAIAGGAVPADGGNGGGDGVTVPEIK